MERYKGRQGVLHLDDELAIGVPAFTSPESYDYTTRYMDYVLDTILSNGLRGSIEDRLKKAGVKESRFYAVLVARNSVYATPYGKARDLAVCEKGKLTYIGDWIRLMEDMDGNNFGALVLSLPNPRGMRFTPEHSLLVMHNNRPEKNWVAISDPEKNRIVVQRKIAV